MPIYLWSIRGTYRGRLVGLSLRRRRWDGRLLGLSAALRTNRRLLVGPCPRMVVGRSVRVVDFAAVENNSGSPDSFRREPARFRRFQTAPRIVECLTASAHNSHRSGCHWLQAARASHGPAGREPHIEHNGVIAFTSRHRRGASETADESIRDFPQRENAAPEPRLPTPLTPRAWLLRIQPEPTRARASDVPRLTDSVGERLRGATTVILGGNRMSEANEGGSQSLRLWLRNVGLRAATLRPTAAGIRDKGFNGVSALQRSKGSRVLLT